MRYVICDGHCRVFCKYFGFPPVRIIPHIPLHVLVYKFALLEGQTVEAWEPSKKAMVFRKYGHVEYKITGGGHLALFCVRISFK